MDTSTAGHLLKLAEQHGTPCFAYLAEPIRQRVKDVRQHFAPRFEISYAVKSNPNIGLLRLLREVGVSLDVSSIGEAERGLAAGFSAKQIGFSGPAKRQFEIAAAVRAGLGEIICESLEQINDVEEEASAQGLIQDVLIRINPQNVPREFGLQMGGRPSQFGFDEEDLDAVVPLLAEMSSIRLAGFHIFSGGNSLNEGAIIENFGILCSLFRDCAAKFDIAPRRLVFGSGFGIPYFDGDKPLDLSVIAEAIGPTLDELTLDPRFKLTEYILEMGRYLVGSDGYMLTSVVGSKHSRGTDIRLCDAGFNNNLSAAGMMGSVMRRDWRFRNLSQPGGQPSHDYLLVGPLCASFDILGTKVHLPTTRRGDILAVESSGAYGLTASPTRFISHPEPEEFIIETRSGETVFIDVTESRANHPANRAHLSAK